MYAFHYHPDTRAYVTGSPVDFSPLEPGVPLVPAWATAIPPAHPFPDGQWPYFDVEIGNWVFRPIEAPAAIPVADLLALKRAALADHLETAQRLVDDLKAMGAA